MGRQGEELTFWEYRDDQVQVIDIPIGEVPRFESFIDRSGDSLVVRGFSGNTLRIFDGPSFATERVFDPPMAESEVFTVWSATVIGDDVYFESQNESDGTSSFWRSDGTEEGIQRVISTNETSIFTAEVVEDNLYVVEFPTESRTEPSTLWTLDNLTGNFEALVSTDAPGRAFSSLSGDILYQTSSAFGDSSELYLISGSEANLLLSEMGVELVSEVDGNLLLSRPEAAVTRELLLFDWKPVRVLRLAASSWVRGGLARRQRLWWSRIYCLPRTQKGFLPARFTSLMATLFPWLLPLEKIRIFSVQGLWKAAEFS